MNFNCVKTWRGVSEQIRILCVFACLMTLISISGCGGSVSQADNTPMPADEQPGPGPTPEPDPQNPVPTPPAGPVPSDEELSLLPVVTAGNRQFADANVLVKLAGSVEPAPETGAQVVRTLWVQTGGPAVRIADPSSLSTMIVVPDVTEASQLKFRLLAEDSEGRVNSATTSVVIVPQPVFARVVGTAVNENDIAAVFTVRLSEPAAQQIVMSYGTVPGTAEVEVDFLPAEGALVFEAGETEKQVVVTLVDDNEPEELKSFSLQVSRTGEGESFSNSGVALINNGIEPELDQEITFTDPGPIDLVEGETYTNALDETVTPQGDGQVVYTSYDLTVASVDQNGLVTGVSPGVATIAARRKADDTYREATAFYDVRVQASNLMAQTIQFENPGPVDVLINGIASNPIVSDPELAPGSGAITYTSRYESVAVVDANGNVVPVGLGGTTITAVKAADLLYASATASYELTVSLVPQTLEFVNPGPLSLPLDAFASNPVVTDPELSPGSGAVTYQSSDDAVAQANPDGSLTLTGVGSATITATKAEDSVYASATNSYSLTVLEPSMPSGAALEFTALIDGTGADLQFSPDLTGYAVITSLDYGCDLATYSSCPGGARYVLDGSPVRDANLTHTSTTYYWLESQSFLLGPIAVTGSDDGISPPPPRYLHSLAAFNNKLWLLGGTENFSAQSGQVHRDSWSSPDGLTWQLENNDIVTTGFITQARTAVFDGELWLYKDPNGNFIRSADGANWTQDPDVSFGTRYNEPVLLSFDSRLWLIAGAVVHLQSESTIPINDVWSYSSAGGWITEVASAAFSPREFAEGVVFANQLWLIGGSGTIDFPLNDQMSGIWTSSDGVTWTEMDANANFSGRREHQLVVHNSRLWLIGGVDGNGNPNAEVWSTADGVTWTLETSTPGFTPRSGFQAVSFDNRIWLIGGVLNDGNNTTLQDTWVTEDGILWQRVQRNYFYQPG